jgi:16S rRNA processing protein RimM
VTERIILGHITTVHGIKGDVVVRSYTADPADLDAYGPLGDDTGKRSFVVEHLRVTPKGVIVRFKGITDRNAAEGLRGIALTVTRDALPDAGDDEFYHADLIGMAAVSPEGNDIGRVIAVQNFGAGDLLEIMLVGTKHTEYVPFTDPFVPTIDVKARRMTVIMPELVGEPEPAEDEATADKAPDKT